MNKKFDTIKIGDTAKIIHIISPEDVKKFIDLTGDNNKLHVDKEYASRTSFKKPVVHGMLGASFISTIIGTKLPGDGSLWLSQSLKFLRPVRLNDKICILLVSNFKSLKSEFLIIETLSSEENK